MNVQATFCATLVDEWVRAGVRHAVVAPGSRSTPLALALAADRRLALHVHHDERAAGFLALGIGKATGVPAVVVTTSGTAAVELHPAVVEASYGGAPLLVATADRPPELQAVGAPQTVDQAHLYGRAVRWFAEPGVADDAARGSWRSLASRAVAESLAPRPGPVHLNLAFRDPLVGAAGDLPEGRPDGAPWHTVPVARRVTDATLDGATARGVIVAGAGAGPDVFDLGEATGWPVLADATSGLRRDRAICAFDALLRHEPFAASVRPDVVVRVGGPPASKVLAQWLAASGARQVAVEPHGAWFDAERTAALVLASLPAVDVEPDPAWTARWCDAEAAAQQAIDRTLAGRAELTEPFVARTVARAAPGPLVVSSSMPIRDVEWYGGPSPARVLANRGANGIDGVVSTAVGVALATGEPTTCLVGDVALLHDANALLGLAGRGADLTVVVVDNRGGGIFSFLPQASVLDPGVFERLFGTPHDVDLPGLAAAHGLTAARVEAPDGLALALATRPPVVVVRTDRAANVAVHEELHAAVAAALGDQP